MDLRQLRYFKAVVTHGSFSEAANLLGRTQQAISKSIAQLEESIGVPLLDRGARTVRPTAVGRLLLQHAETIELQIDSFTEQITSLRQSSAGKVKIGTGPTAATNLLPSALLQLNQKQSQIAIEVYAGIASQMLPQLLTGELDLFLSIEMDKISHPDVTKEVLGYECFSLIASSAHPAAVSDNPSLRELAQYPWIMGRNLGELAPEVDQFFLADNLDPPKSVIYTTSLTFALQAIATPPYIGILPRSIVATYLSQGKLTLLNDRQISWKRPMVLVYSKQRPLTPAILSVINALYGAAKMRDKSFE